MNKFAAHSLKAAALIAMAGGAIIGGVAHTSAGAPSTWITANDGCYYLTDDGGQTATEAACPRADGSVDVYVAESGQWLYSQTVGGNVVQQSPDQVSTPASPVAGSTRCRQVCRRRRATSTWTPTSQRSTPTSSTRGCSPTAWR